MVKFLLALLWLGIFTYAGYALTVRSFSFLDQPSPGLKESFLNFDLGKINLGGLADKFPDSNTSPNEWYANLTKAQQKCISSSVDPARLNAALGGEELEPTPLEAIKVANCLK